MNNDLISREALKKALHNFFDGKVIDEPAYILRDVFYHIDNAPTVESEKAKESELIKAYTKGFDTGVETVKTERPQGKWVFSKEHQAWTCTHCGGYFGEIDNKEIYFYCPNCGADMKGGEE